MATPSKWARWHWKDTGIGRWHALAGGTSEGTVALACGRVRKAPAETAARPSNDKCCPTCRSFDDLRLGYKAETAEDLIATIAIPVKAAPELVTVGDLTPPDGICICGCDTSDEAVEWRRKVEADKERRKAEALAGFEAYLAEKATEA
jgi:hypothetical protein